MTAPTISSFRSELRTRNIARPNQFFVQILRPDALLDGDNDLASMWCHSAQTPHMFISTNDNFVEAGVKRKYAYDVDFQNLVLNFYVDQDFKIKQFFDEWKQAVVPYNRNFSYPELYTAKSLTVFILNAEDQITYAYEYTNVYPKTINSMDLNFANGTAILDLNIEFVFEDVYYTQYDLGNAVNSSKPENFTEVFNNRYNNEITQSNPEPVEK